MVVSDHTRNAVLKTAVSRNCIPHGFGRFGGASEFAEPQRSATPRHGRLQICATPQAWFGALEWNHLRHVLKVVQLRCARAELRFGATAGDQRSTHRRLLTAHQERIG
jgi:hypothetical protein